MASRRTITSTRGWRLACGSGIPPWPKDFRHYCHQQNPKAGHAWLWAGPERVIINLMTQEPAPDNKAHPGKASAHNITHALKEMCKIVEKEGITSVAMPRLATGVGGLDWAEVEPLITNGLGGLNIPVIVYDTYEKGRKATESLA